MTASGADDNLTNFERLDGLHTFMIADDGRESLEDVRPFLPSDEERPDGSRDEEDEGEPEGDYTSRVRGSVNVAMPGDDDHLDADETTLPFQCSPGYALSRSASAALDASLVNRHIMPRRL